MHHTLEQLEKDVWPEPDVHTNLIDSCHRLRKVPVSALSEGDIRMLLGQRIGVRFLVPRAIELLDLDPMLEASFYPGDLLAAVLGADLNRYRGFPQIRSKLVDLAFRAKQAMSKSDDELLSHQQLLALLTDYNL